MNVYDFIVRVLHESRVDLIGTLTVLSYLAIGQTLHSLRLLLRLGVAMTADLHSEVVEVKTAWSCLKRSLRTLWHKKHSNMSSLKHRKRFTKDAVRRRGCRRRFLSGVRFLMQHKPGA